ncbi:MAG: sigma-70 family RNA polymerase sigma factor [Spirochaetaceae bacterium]|jgi:RNA polymerase sigma factor|nr:sigma-70 family RNA polymerase sigma factor [Spirochaetaceae bacterium]
MNEIPRAGEERSLREQLERAKTDNPALNRCIHAYMPFIKKCVTQVFFKPQERRDHLSEGMLGFIQSVKTYKGEEGAFIPYAQTVIRHRLIDAARRERGMQKSLSSGFPETGEGASWEYEASQRSYDLQEEQKQLQLEIGEIDAELAQWGFDCFDLVRDCPKQERSRRTCHAVVRRALESETLVAQMRETRKLPVKALAQSAGVSDKVIDKYRRYILALILMVTGDYPYMHTFLPDFFDQEATR